ncbi:MAG: hypothetical protein AB7I30_11760 [Isosphaeraceae bacterium]
MLGSSRRGLLRVALAGALVAIGGKARAGEAPGGLRPPVRIEAAGEVIDSGPRWGHSGPCFHDVDGDGKRDLLVGDFSGLFRLHRNVGADAAPRFAEGVVLRAGGVDAKVPIY